MRRLLTQSRTPAGSPVTSPPVVSPNWTASRVRASKPPHSHSRETSRQYTWSRCSAVGGAAVPRHTKTNGPEPSCVESAAALELGASLAAASAVLGPRRYRTRASMGGGSALALAARRGGASGPTYCSCGGPALWSWLSQPSTRRRRVAETGHSQSSSVPIDGDKDVGAPARRGGNRGGAEKAGGKHARISNKLGHGWD